MVRHFTCPQNLHLSPSQPIHWYSSDFFSSAQRLSLIFLFVEQRFLVFGKFSFSGTKLLNCSLVLIALWGLILEVMVQPLHLNGNRLVTASCCLVSIIFDLRKFFLLSGLYIVILSLPQFGSQVFLLVISVFSTFWKTSSFCILFVFNLFNLGISFFEYSTVCWWWPLLLPNFQRFLHCCQWTYHFIVQRFCYIVHLFL